jgi:sugar lactone lactonase YvrE
VPEFTSCLLGETYAFEPVPTDVEVGRRGVLSVSTLPGGPEDPSAGARGSVYHVNPATGASTRFATGFASPTNLAVAGDGTTYVAELFGGRISKVTMNGAVSTFKEVNVPLALEVRGGFVYAATAGIFGPPGSGSIIQYRR